MRHDDPILLPGDERNPRWVNVALWLMMLSAWGAVVGFWAAYFFGAVG